MWCIVESGAEASRTCHERLQDLLRLLAACSPHLMLMKELHLLQHSARKFEQVYSNLQWHRIEMQLAVHYTK